MKAKIYVTLKPSVLDPQGKAIHHAVETIGYPVDFIWHRQSTLNDCDAVILPGGFSYGDYLRTGAIARFSPVMGAVKEFAARGGLVLGICNGFQILCEAGLLPGALLRNANLKFICEHVNMRVETTDTPFTNRCQRGQVLSVPIAHGDGNYYCDAADRKSTRLNSSHLGISYAVFCLKK